MARKKAAAARLDSCGRKLNKGESQRADGRYVYQWTDAEKKRRSFYADTLQDLREQEKQLEADLHDGIRSERPNVNAFYDLMMQQKTGLKESTRRTYIQTYDSFIRDGIGRRTAADIRPMDIEEFYSGILDDGNAANTLNRVHTVLNPCFNLAVENDYIRKNPCSGILTRVKNNHGCKKAKKKALSGRDVERFLAFAETEKQGGAGFVPAIKVMLLTGCRISEVLGLTMPDIDFKRGRIHVERELIHQKAIKGIPAKWEITVPKTDAGIRCVPMNKDCADAVRAAVMYRMKRGCTSTVDGVSNFVFVGRNGTVQDYHQVNRYIAKTIEQFNEHERAVAAAEGREADLMPDFTCHILRHTFASQCIENDVNPKLLQQILGHANASTTLDIYAEFRDDKLEQGFDEVKQIVKLA